MIREAIADTLVGIIALALLGLISMAIGELPSVVALLLVAAGSIGFVLRLWFREWREGKRHRAGSIVPIGRASRSRNFPDGPINFPFPLNSDPPQRMPNAPPLSFPDRPIVPRKDATFGP